MPKPSGSRACLACERAARVADRASLAEANAPGFAPGIQVKLSVLKPGEKSAAFRHNATEVNFCIGGSGHTLVAGKRIAFAQYDVWNHPLMRPTVTSTTARIFRSASLIRTCPASAHAGLSPRRRARGGTAPGGGYRGENAVGRSAPQESYGMIRIGADGGMLMPYEILINPEAVVSKPCTFPGRK